MAMRNEGRREDAYGRAYADGQTARHEESGRSAGNARHVMRAPEWNMDGQQSERRHAELGDEYRPRGGYSRVDDEYDRSSRDERRGADYARNGYDGRDRDYRRGEDYARRNDDYGREAGYGRGGDYGREYDLPKGTEYERAGRPARGAGYGRSTRREYAPEFENARGASPIFGGSEHDNLPAADARPRVGSMPLIAMAAVLLLIMFVPLMINGGAKYTVSDAGKPATPALNMTGNGAGADTAVAAATAQPTQALTPEPTSDNMLVSQYTGRTLDRTKPAVALTFDDGPSGQTPRILDALEKHGGLATFFLVGNRIDGHADTARRAYEMGCLLGTHLYSHSKLTEMTAEEIRGELESCSAAHIAAVGAAPEVARPPYGSVNDAVKQALDMPLINWSLDSRDWETKDADRIYNDVMNNVQDGDIVLFHDLKEFSASAIERIVPALIEQGYQVVTVQELFELKGRSLEPATLYNKRVTAPDTSAG